MCAPERSGHASVPSVGGEVAGINGVHPTLIPGIEKETGVYLRVDR